MKSLLELLAHLLESPYLGKSTSMEAFWRTLLKDTMNGRPAGQDARHLFSVLIALHVWELEESLSNVLKDTDEFATLSATYSQTKDIISELSTRDTNGIMPTWDDIQRLIEIGRDETMPKNEELNKDSDHIQESFRVAYSGRRLFRTASNYVGIAAQSLQKGDAVWVLAGAAVPIVLRGLPNGNWKLVGEAYVHDIMNGEAVRVDNIALEKIYLE